MTISRRGLLCGLAASLAAPAIVRIDNIMPVRNRLITPSMLYEVPTEYTFSCYLKGEEGHQFVRQPGNTWESWNAVGNGWWRYSVRFASMPGESKVLQLPLSSCWGAQVEADGAMNIDLALKGPEGDGVYVLPTFVKDWPRGLI